MELSPSKGLSGEIYVPGDKSISHRAVMLGAISEGITEIRGFLKGNDCLSTIKCFENLGIRINEHKDIIKVNGKGLRGMSPPGEVLYAGNSGTTTRLISGIMAGQKFNCIIDGDESIRKRPMDRIITPLSLMGSTIEAANGSFCPLNIHGGSLKGITYKMPVASAQIKSCVLFAGLYADSETTVIEEEQSRNHTELMFREFGANIDFEGCKITVYPADKLNACPVNVPGDISSAAFFIVSALIIKNSSVTIKNVGVNPTRTGILEVLTQMGADIKIENIGGGFEPRADITVKSSRLKGVTIGGEIIPRLIDELPVIAVAACFAEGATVIKDAGELKVKESNRIDTISNELTKAGVKVIKTEDGMIINGTDEVKGAVFDSHKDHRIAMSMSVLALAANGSSSVLDSEVASVSYPNFYETLNGLSK